MYFYIDVKKKIKKLSFYIEKVKRKKKKILLFRFININYFF